MSKKSMYVHLLDNQPAFFDDGQICFATHGIEFERLLVPTLRQIRREQQATIAYRNTLGWKDGFKYSYLRVTVKQ